MEIVTIHHFPHLRMPARDRRGRFLRFLVPAIVLDKNGVREGNAGFQGMAFARFMQACAGYENEHGRRAPNDFQHQTERPAKIVRDAARAASPGGKECGEESKPCVAPSVENARIGAFLL